MGLFSSLCEGCRHPAISGRASSPVNGWMKHVVAIMPDGDLHAGEYDGYGAVGAAEYAVGFDSTVWHEACWQLAGQPAEYTGPSESALDQGYFFANEHDVPDPRLRSAARQAAGEPDNPPPDGERRQPAAATGPGEGNAGARTWLVCHMDDGVLRREQTDAAARHWFRDWASAAEPAAGRYGPGDHEGQQAGEGQETITAAWIVRADRAELGGWDKDQDPLYPLDDQPFERFDRVTEPEAELEPGL